MPPTAKALSVILRERVLPAVRLQTVDDVLRALDAILEGGLPVAEIAMSSPKAVAMLEAAVNRFGDRMMIGAGTVLDEATARLCIAAGARFLVSPSLQLEVIRCARRYSVPVLPGALTPTEIISAWEAGADIVKVFPASSLGGPSYLRALSAPLPHIALMPMGGVTVDTAEEYLRAGAVALGVGGDVIRQHEFAPGQTLKIATRVTALRAIVEQVAAGSAAISSTPHHNEQE